jgi:hypothetical protein
MTISIEVPPEIEAGLVAEASARGLSPHEYLRYVLMERFRETACEPGAPSGLLEKMESLVLRTGRPIDPAVIDATLASIREERAIGNIWPPR